MKRRFQKVRLRRLGEILIPGTAYKPIQRQGVVKELPLCCVSPLNPEGVKKSIWFFFTSFRRTPDRSPGQAPESSVFRALRTDWTPVFTGVTAEIQFFDAFH